jgi:membrane protein
VPQRITLAPRNTRQMPSFFSRLSHTIWDPSLATRPRWTAGLIKGARIAIALVRDFLAGTLSLRATSLVYTTLLSMVPLLAFAFSVVKALGVKNVIAPLLHDLFAPLGPQGDEVATRIVGFVQNMQVGVLGSLGLLFLIYTAISLIGQIEDTFNFIWRVEQPRSWSQRFATYVSVLLVAPMLVVTATGITASISSSELVTWLLAVRPFSEIAYVLGLFVPYLLIVVALAHGANCVKGIPDCFAK